MTFGFADSNADISYLFLFFFHGFNVEIKAAKMTVNA